MEIKKYFDRIKNKINAVNSLEQLVTRHKRMISHNEKLPYKSKSGQLVKYSYIKCKNKNQSQKS